MRYVLIMAGGSGKRLWPLSRQDMPKQLLKVVGGNSLLRIAYERLAGVVPPENVLVCTGADYADVVAAELPEMTGRTSWASPRAATRSTRSPGRPRCWPRRDPDAVIAVVTADQIMHPVSAFQAALDEGFEVAETDPSALVTFGVVPTSPHTGYGYLQRGEALPRPPDGAARCWRSRRSRTGRRPRRYLASGDYWWNSGMFVWRAQHPARPADSCCRTRTRRSPSWPPHPTGWRRSIPT